MLQLIPLLALFGRWTLDFRESKCFLRRPETLTKMKEKLHSFLNWTVSIQLCTVNMTIFIELNRLYTTQLTVVILQLVTSATRFGLV